MPTVLVVDDSAVARHALTSRLTAKGATIVEADSVATAAAIDIMLVHAALLDIDLGDGDGVSLARVMHAKHPALPIAFFTAEDGTALALEAAKIGAVFAKNQADEAATWALASALGA
ncbi:MAG: response regulator [Polyangiaceae bacterium]